MFTYIVGVAFFGSMILIIIDCILRGFDLAGEPTKMGNIGIMLYGIFILIALAGAVWDTTIGRVLIVFGIPILVIRFFIKITKDDWEEFAKENKIENLPLLMIVLCAFAVIGIAVIVLKF